jgi:hypothetical protein
MTRLIEQELLERFVKATAFKLRYVTCNGDNRFKVHLNAYGKEIVAFNKHYNLCGLEYERLTVEIGKHYSDKGMCKKCLERLTLLARKIANDHKADLWALASGDHFSLKNAELRAALEAPNVWGEFEEEAPKPALLPEDFLPKGSGRLIKRSWD